MDENIKSKIILYFHNDPLTMKNSITINERLELLKKTKKIIFNSNWCMSRFTLNLKVSDYQNKLLVIPQSTSKTKINFKLKKKIISFVGKLNESKGYDIFGKAIIKILDEFNDWTAVVFGDEPRQKYFFEHKNLISYGFKKNSFVLNKLKEVSISVVPSRWNEPFGRSSIEASSRGSALIISNTGGLTETTKDAIIISKINEIELYKKIKILIKNIKLRKKLQKKTYKNFFLTNKYVSSLVDNLRKTVISNLNTLSIINRNSSLKILHITNLNERFDGRLHYNTGKRITNGFVRLGHNVLNLSDRDVLSSYKSLTDPSGIKFLNNKILNTHKNFKSDLVVLGHVDRLKKDTILEIKKTNNAKICQWFLDPLMLNGPDYIKNKKRILSLHNQIDTTFLTTHPNALNFKIKNSYFMPNPCDTSFEMLDNTKLLPSRDLFFAMSHGVHRGVLKDGKIDEREDFLMNLSEKLNGISFDKYGMEGIQPIWGEEFLNTLKNYSMALNLSRGKPIKYYSSDRIVQLMGNGLLTFIDKNTLLNEIITKEEAVFYNDVDDLIKKINFYKKNQKKLKRIASNGKKGYFKKFNSNIICQFIIDKTLNYKSKIKYAWN